MYGKGDQRGGFHLDTGAGAVWTLRLQHIKCGGKKEKSDGEGIRGEILFLLE